MLKVSKPAPPSWYHEYEFDKDSVTIGREAKNDLQLEGINSVVSREHARIIRKSEGYVLVDLKSMNFTFLKGKKLKPWVEHVLGEGDIIKICDYEIEFSLKTDLVTAERECLAPAEPPPPNPFRGGLEELARILEQLSVAYDLSESPAKKDEFCTGLEEVLKGLKDRKAAEILGETLGGERRRPTRSFEHGPTDVDILRSYEQINRFLDVFLEFFVKLIQARLQFRQEFLGETIVKSKSFTLDNCTVEGLKDFLFDPALSPAESQRRIGLAANVLEELLVHQFSLLEGYKASVNEASRQFLDRVNPARLKKEVGETRLRLGVAGVPYRYLPVLRLVKLVESFSEVYKELTTEDKAYLEQRYFRTAFKQGYYKWTRAPRGKKENPEK